MATYQEILSQLQQKKYMPVYFLYGDEPFFIDKITDYISKNVLTDAEKGFNQSVFYGKDVQTSEILETAKRYPMMSEYQVVIIREAQDLKNIDDLEGYMQAPVSSTILVLAFKYKKPDGRKKVVKLMKKNGTFLEAKPIYDNQMPKWISEYVHLNHRKISAKATMLISEYIGANLTLASNEIDKLFLTIREGEQIDDQAVNDGIGINKDYNNFELQKALGSRNFLRSMQIVDYFSFNSKAHPFVVTLSTLAKYFSNLMLLYFSPNASKNDAAKIMGVHPFFIDEYYSAKTNYSAQSIVKIIELLREYDLKSKGVGQAATPSGELLRELIFKILKA